MRVCFCVAVLSLASAASAVACPSCPQNLGPTLSAQVAEADISLVVEWVGAVPADIDAGLPGATEYKVASVLRDTTGTIEKGDPIEISRHRRGARRDRFLLLGVADGRLRWSSPLPLSAVGVEYMQQAPNPDAPVPDRLRFFAGFLEHPDVVVAGDAFAEFAAAKYEDVVAVAESFDAAEVRNWLADGDTHPLRLGLYGLLLGQRGDAEDAEFLKQEILRPKENFPFGLEGMISGYLLLTGDDGLQVIEDSKLRDPNADFSETLSAMQSLRFMWSHAEGVISKDGLRAAMRSLLERPELADLVINDLARWQDWSVVDRLMELYDAEGYNLPSIKRSIVRYYLVALRAEDDGVPGEHVAQAHQYLDQLRESDPETVKKAERLFLLY